MDKAKLMKLLTVAIQQGASDVHLQAGSPPSFRIRGDLVPVKMGPLTDDDMNMICKVVSHDPEWEEKASIVLDHDGAIDLEEVGRFRFNIFRHLGHLGVILRIVAAIIPTFKKLELPPSLKQIAKSRKGLVLVTGATGSGKSTTLAAMVEYLNQTYPMHIVSIEDPIEFIHVPRRSRITQREVGHDTGSFASALRAALRQDPDVILVGEMRDRETIEIALTAAETGHMVLSTLHTQDVVKAIGRLVGAFASDEEPMARARIGDCLNAVINQRLVPRADGSGLIAAVEVMINNSAITGAIGSAQTTAGIRDFIKKGFKNDLTGMQTFDQHLVWMVARDIITPLTARAASSNEADFDRNIIFDGRTNDELHESSYVTDESGEAAAQDPMETANAASASTSTRSLARVLRLQIECVHCDKKAKALDSSLPGSSIEISSPRKSSEITKSSFRIPKSDKPPKAG